MNKVTKIADYQYQRRCEVKDFYLKIPVKGHDVDISGKYSTFDGLFQGWHIETVFIHGCPDWDVMIKIREVIDTKLGGLLS